MALQRVTILVFTGNPRLFCCVLGSIAHVMLLESAPESVVDHRVNQLLVTVAEPLARPRQQEGRVAHRLHPASDDDLSVAQLQRLSPLDDGLEPRTADFVDRDRRDGGRQPAVNGRLPRWGLAEPGLNHAAQHDFVNFITLEPIALLERPNDLSPELRGGELRKSPLKAPHRCAHRIDNDYSLLCHAHHVPSFAVIKLFDRS